jgi:spermidine synthase
MRTRTYTAAICGLLVSLVFSFSIVALGADYQNTLLESRESKYNSIFIYRNDDMVSMTFGHNKRIFTESVYDTKDPLDLPVEYTRFMTVIAAYVDDLSDVLEIGLGGGRTAWYLHTYLPSAHITTLELDPDVVALAKKYFAIREDSTYHIVVSDGRLYLNDNLRLYDAVLIDAYRGPFVPFHLLTKQFYEVVKSHLKPGGVVAQNVEPSTMLFDAAVVTVKSVFQNIDLYDAGGNVVMVAYDGPPRSQSDLIAAAKDKQVKFQFRYPLPELVAERRQVVRLPNANVLTDDFAPVEALKAVQRHNQKLDALSDKPK